VRQRTPGNFAILRLLANYKFANTGTERCAMVRTIDLHQVNSIILMASSFSLKPMHQSLIRAQAAEGEYREKNCRWFSGYAGRHRGGVSIDCKRTGTTEKVDAGRKAGASGADGSSRSARDSAAASSGRTA
jgi:hypothetical protein